MARAMRATANRPRVQQLTPETGDALKNTLNGLATCSRYLLRTIDPPIRHEYVLLGFFQQDDLEHHFGHFRRSNGCNYYVSVREVMSTHFLDRSKEILKFDDFDATENPTASHQCDLCSKELTLPERQLLDDIVSVEEVGKDLDSDEIMGLVYAAGYVAHKHPNLGGDGSNLPSWMTKYITELSRGGLDYPTLPFMHFFILAQTFAVKSNEAFCRVRLIKILSVFPEIFDLPISPSKRALQRVCNILLKNKEQRGHAGSHEKNRKIRKLTSA